jgi:hypothetical protein
MTSNSKAVQSIIQDFQSPEPEMVLKAIKTNRKEGNQDSFKALLSLLKDTDEPLVEASIIEFLYDLKDEESVPVLIEAIQDDEFAFYHNFLVAGFWQSAIDGSDYLEEFVTVAINGEYMTSLEALTVVENFDRAYNQNLLLDLEADLNEALEKEENDDKKALLVGLSDVIRNLPIEGE